ncbi:sensor histidine kinase [Stenotrophomonas maltophilia]|nr:sensor histidine kinase [Stenotrophomonas maltophilia]NMT72966.1 sensor histidine kinase [Stenotrophomonas maltophilia]
MSLDEDLKFRFSTSILHRLGEELVPNLDQAIVELIRNAYDADASRCAIELHEIQKVGGSIRVVDNGTGMSLDDIREGWLLLGGSRKRSSNRTIAGRLPVGNKGLGRLAALRAGSNVRLITRKSTDEPAILLEIDWKRFDAVRVVDDVALEARTVNCAQDFVGTDILIEGLRKPISKGEVARLGRSLALLTDPFENVDSFKVELSAAEFPGLERKIDSGYLEDADYVLSASLDDDGIGHAEVRDWKGAILFRADSNEWVNRVKESSPAQYGAPSARFELYAFILKRENFTGRRSTIGELREWLKHVGGVHLYHRTFRVPPYGDPGFDWLDMNLARARSPEERPSTNNSVGRVIVEDPSGLLIQKTDRIGFIESDEFSELRRFAKDALEWFARQRLREAERRREAKRSEERRDEGAALEALENNIKVSVPASKQDETLKALQSLKANYVKQINSIKEDLLLYRSLATAGTTAAVFAHEIGKPITQIVSSQKRIRSRSEGLKPKVQAERLKEPLDLIVRSSERLQQFAGMQIDLLRTEKRRQGAVDVGAVVTSIHQQWKPILKDTKTSLSLIKDSSVTSVIYGAEALVETIVTNCLTNAIKAFESNGAKLLGRSVEIHVRNEGDTVALEIIDNGPGFSMEISEIWLPGRTTKLAGTGFGLTIVKDSCLDMGGKYSAYEESSGGARFRFVFPRIEL